MAKVRIDNLDENSDIAYLRRLIGESCDPTEISIHAREGRVYALITIDLDGALQIVELFRAYRDSGHNFLVSYRNRPIW